MVHSHSLSLGVNTELLDVAPPTSWADLWHPRFADMVCPGSIELTPGLLFLLQASFQNGGSYEDMEPGFQAIRELAPNIRKFYRGLGEVRPLLNSENVVLAVSSNVTQGEVDKGNPIGVILPEEGCLASPAVAQVVRGTQVKELAERFIDQYLRPEVQFQWAKNFYLRRMHSHRRQGRQPDPHTPAQPGHGLPEARTVPPHDRLREHRVRTQ